jgi:predicted nucleic acid-binding Zn ribbon protein
MMQENRQLNSSRQWSSKRPKSFAGVLGKVISSLGLSNTYNGWLVVTRFNEIVGPAIAGKANAVGYEDGCLFVAVKDAAWRQELAMRHDELLEKIRKLPYGQSVKHIRLVQGTKGSE